MKRAFCVAMLGLFVFTQSAFATSKLESADTSELINQAQELQSSIQAHLSKVSQRLSFDQAKDIWITTSNGAVRVEESELKNMSEWYYFESISNANIEATDEEVNSLIQDFMSEKASIEIFKSNRINRCSKQVIRMLKEKKATAAAPEALANLKKGVITFNQIMHSLETRNLNDSQRSTVMELSKWGKTTVILERSFNIQKITLKVNKDGSDDMEFLQIDEVKYIGYDGQCHGDAREVFRIHNSTVTPVVLYK